MCTDDLARLERRTERASALRKSRATPVAGPRAKTLARHHERSARRPGLSGRVDATRMQNAAAVAERVWLAPRRRMCGGACARLKHKAQCATALRKPRATPVASPRGGKTGSRPSRGLCMFRHLDMARIHDPAALAELGWLAPRRTMCRGANALRDHRTQHAPALRNSRTTPVLGPREEKPRLTSTRVELGA